MLRSQKCSGSLELSCWDDELSPAQLSAFEKAAADHINIKEKLKDLFVSHSAEEVYLGELFSAYQLSGKVSDLESLDKFVHKFTEKKKPEPITRQPPKRRYRDDDDEDLPLVKRAGKSRGKEKEKEKPVPLTKSLPPTNNRKSKVTKSVEKEKVPAISLRPSESTAIGGLTIGTKDGLKAGLDPKEVAINKLQGKTFPSLVVVAKPSLIAKEPSAAERYALDSKVKVVLMFTAAKFTEWLIQQGLLKSEQKCALHSTNQLKLGVYSDGSKFPYSGGYVWISDCCPTRFVSVFHGSLFDGAPNPPSSILKLIYHWSCQTNIQNIVQWVKVDNMYIKGIYTWLRAICTLAIHEHLRPMGGIGQNIEVGVISLGTTSQDGQQRQVKVEVLGVLDPVAKTIRLRAVQPFPDGDKNYKRRFSKILEPLNEWVRKDSLIAIDMTVDKNTLNSMGYKNVIQVAANDTNAKHTNANVMDYLRRIVPRMFQNTLSLLSRQMIQQFLDELVWREQYGIFPLQAFDNITKHIAEQTRFDSSEQLIPRLYKVATNPFNNWSLSALKASEPSTSSEIQRRSTAARKQPTSSKDTSKKNVKSTPESIGVEELFYGILYDSNPHYKYEPFDVLNADCPECKILCSNNIELQDHIISHINSNEEPIQCRYCLEKFTHQDILDKHISLIHPIDTKNTISSSYSCILCENRFNSVYLLTSHLQKVHVFHELPYKCSACDFRSSSHRKTIDHFYEIHINTGAVQCPFCLTGFRVFVNGKILTENIGEYFSHLQKHFFKNQIRKCSRCSLNFIHKGSLKVHLMYDHKSGHPNVERLIENKTFILSHLYPKIKNQYIKDEPLVHHTIGTFDKLEKYIEEGKLCLECDLDFEEDHHMEGLLKCDKCRYQTCCLRAMLDHTATCQSGYNPESNVHITLDKEWHCVCGFSSSDGNSLARHLAACEHKSAYPSVEAAQENTVQRNMLDMLGLVRREEDIQNKDDDIQTVEDDGDIQTIEDDTEENKQDENPEIVALDDQDNQENVQNEATNINDKEDEVENLEEEGGCDIQQTQQEESIQNMEEDIQNMEEDIQENEDIVHNIDENDANIQNTEESIINPDENIDIPEPIESMDEVIEQAPMDAI